MILTPDATLALGLVAPLGVAAIAWALKRWVTRLDGKLDALSSQMGDLRLRGAVADERYAGLLGALDSLRLDIKGTTKDVGRVTGAVEKLWAVLEAKGLLEPRASDRLVDRTGSKG